MNLAFALVAFLKGKARLGAFGLFLPGVALFGAVRLAQPGSLWARRSTTRTSSGEACTRAGVQHRRYTHLKHRVYDAIGRAPHAGRHADHTG